MSRLTTTTTLLLVTGNVGKAREFESILGHPVERLDIDLPEIQALNVADVVEHKARAAFAVAGRPVMVEDTGLSLAALNGLPGALIRWFVGGVGPAGICALIPPGADRSATARTAIGWCDGGDVRVFTGEIAGTILHAPRGTGGFGWDPAFLPDGASGTFAELELGEKNRFSMRRIALDQFRAALLAGD
ncbi:MAG TPA: non-canonical purine NTP pyrophosphatase [Thermomicrobiales bacterium]|nr:non-canonical purine NTP pyrophosphatase [Thermomicrobiales bacterium]